MIPSALLALLYYRSRYGHYCTRCNHCNHATFTVSCLGINIRSWLPISSYMPVEYDSYIVLLHVIQKWFTESTHNKNEGGYIQQQLEKVLEDGWQV